MGAKIRIGVFKDSTLFVTKVFILKLMGYFNLLKLTVFGQTIF